MLVNSNSSEYMFRVLGTTKERGFYSTTGDLRNIIQLKFSNTVACVGNPRLRLESGAVEVEAPFRMVVSPAAPATTQPGQGRNCPRAGEGVHSAALSSLR